MQKRLEAVISGEVHGVNFRRFVRDHARELGIVGFVRNEPDSSVYVAAEGEERALQRFEPFLRAGPFWARVRDVDIKYSEAQGAFSNFEIQ